VSPKDVNLVQVGTFGDKGRYPRGWTVTVAYACVVPTTKLGVKAADDANQAKWYGIDALPPLAFDHKMVVKKSFERLAETSVGPIVELLKKAAVKLQWTSELLADRTERQWKGDSIIRVKCTATTLKGWNLYSTVDESAQCKHASTCMQWIEMKSKDHAIC